MSHKDKLASARTILEEFNKSAPNDSKIDIDAFFKRLEKNGGVSEEILGECTWEDIQDAGAPRLIARRIATVFREKPAADAPKFISDKKAAQYQNRELISVYDPNDIDSPVANELHKRSSGKRFLFIDDAGKVDVDASFNELNAIKAGHPERDVAKLGSKAFTLRRAKDRQPTLAEENPVYKGRALRPDGACDQTNRSWADVPLEVRQLVRIAIDLGEASIKNIDDAHAMIDRAIAGLAVTTLRDRYVRTAARFDELQKQGELPKLRVVFGASRKSNDPFFREHVSY